MPFSIVLEYPTKEANFGLILRTAYNFNCSSIITIGHKYKRVSTDTPDTEKQIPIFHFKNWNETVLPQAWTVIGVEILKNSKSILNFSHPKSATYIFGPENSSLSKEAQDICNYIIQIPTNHCLNLSITAAIIMYDRIVKRKN